MRAFLGILLVSAPFLALGVLLAWHMGWEGVRIWLLSLAGAFGAIGCIVFGILLLAGPA